MNLNMTRKVRAHAFLFFNKSFLARARARARGFDVSPLPTTDGHVNRTHTFTLLPPRIDRPTIVTAAAAAANTNSTPARHSDTGRKCALLSSSVKRGAFVASTYAEKNLQNRTAKFNDSWRKFRPRDAHSRPLRLRPAKHGRREELI